jgi:hypothetical protein
MDICHANNGNGTGGWVKNNVSIDSIIRPGGHAVHQNGRDIIPPFDYVKNGVSQSFPGLNWDQAGQAIFDNGCKVPTPRDALASATVTTQPGCGVTGVVVFDIANATWDNTYDTSDGSRSATAKQGHLFANGTNKIVVTYTPVKALDENAAPCVLTPEAPEVVPSTYTCAPDGTGTTSQATVTLPASDHYSWKMKKGNGHHYTTVSGTIDLAPGTYTFKAYANDGYSIAAGSSSFPVTIVAPETTTCLIVDTPPVAPTVTDAVQTCTAGVTGTTNGTVTLADGPWTWFDGQTPVTSGEFAAGSYTFTAVADSGHVFAGGVSSLPFQVTVGTTELDSPCLTPLTIDVDPSSVDQVCLPDGITPQSGGINVVLDTNLEYTITGADVDPITVTDAFTALEPGTYTVTVKAINGYALEEGITTEWSFVINAASDCGTFNPPTEGLVTPMVQCNPDGSYTFGEANGFNSEITWTVDGTARAAGTYRVTKAGSVTVVGTPVGTSFEDGYASPYTQTLYFVSPTECGTTNTQLTTLAFTGVDRGAIGLGAGFAAALLLLGGSLLLWSRRFRFGSDK